MPRRVIKGAGMMARETLTYDLREPGGVEACMAAWGAFFEQYPAAMPDDAPGDALRRGNAERCRAILATVGLEDDGACAINPVALRDRGLTEDTAQWLAAEWLAAFHMLKRCRERFVAGNTSANTIGSMLMAAEELGRLQERMWWRCGIDPETGKRREELALGKRAQEKAISRATEARRIQAQDARPDWHDSATFEAEEIRRKHPSYSRWRIAGMLHEKFGVSQNRCDKVLRANGIR